MQVEHDVVAGGSQAPRETKVVHHAPHPPRPFHDDHIIQMGIPAHDRR
jgi:hypothetical protein